MFTNQEAEYLLTLPKKIIIDDVFQDFFSIKQLFPFTQKSLLGSEENEDYIFLMEARQSSKFSIKFDLHHQEDQTKIGLVRINYFGKHKNPEYVTNNVPVRFHKYAGRWFNYNDHHIHYYVEAINYWSGLYH